jgi:hypothetical protein
MWSFKLKELQELQVLKKYCGDVFVPEKHKIQEKCRMWLQIMNNTLIYTCGLVYIGMQSKKPGWIRRMCKGKAIPVQAVEALRVVRG